MRRLRPITVVLAMTLAAACGGGGSGDEALNDAPSTTRPSPASTAASVPTTSPGATVSGTNLTLRIADLRLENSEESDSGMRVLLPAGVASASVTLTGLPSPNRVITVCQARELDRRMSAAACRTPASGEAVTVTLGAAATGVEIVQVGVAGPGPAGNVFTLEEATIRYTASSRDITARLPQIASGGASGRPTFGLTPPGAEGHFNVTLNWNVIQVFGGTPSSAQLELVQGGNVAGQAQGTGSQAQLSGKATGEAAIRIQNTGTAALVTPKLTALLP